MTQFMIYLYKEGDPMDGDEFACGPFADETDADNAAADLAGFGQVRVLPMFAAADELIEVLTP